MIDVVNDAEGVRMALEEIFEEDFVRARVRRESAHASEETQERLLCQVPLRTLSPGYYKFGEHLLLLEAEQKAGVGLSAGELLRFEARGLVALAQARGNFGYRHPACSACGTRQQNRFGVECGNCGTKFRRKGI